MQPFIVSPFVLYHLIPLKAKRASLDNILIIEVGEGVDGTVEADALNLMLGRGALGAFNNEGAAFHLDCGALKEGLRNPITSAGGFYLIKSERCEDVPCRHLSHVFVSAESFGGIVIECVEHLMHQLVGALGAPEHGIHI